MGYVADGRSVVDFAFEQGFALPAFNVCSVEMVRGCLEAAGEMQAPIILQTYPSDMEQVSPEAMTALVRVLAESISVPVFLNLDHGSSFEMAMRCLRAGYGSVMFDGAGMEFDRVIRETRHIAEAAHAMGAAVEVAAESFNHGSATATRAEDVDYLFEAGADMVAVSVGSEHGRKSRLDLLGLKAIAEHVRRPLVLHGGSGIPGPDIAAARELGVVKVNIGTAVYRHLREVWLGSGNATSHRAVYERVRQAVKEVAVDKIRTIAGDRRGLFPSVRAEHG